MLQEELIKIVHTLKEGFIMGCLTASEEEWVKNFDTKRVEVAATETEGDGDPRDPREQREQSQ